MVRRQLSLRDKPIDWPKARTLLCCAPWQPRMLRVANSRTRLKPPALRSNSRGCTARILSRRISINRSRYINSECRTGKRQNSAKARVNRYRLTGLTTDALTIQGCTIMAAKPTPSQLVTQDFENGCALDNTLQRTCSGPAAECNDIFNGDQRRLCVERRRLGLFLCRLFGFSRVLVHR